MKKIPHQVRPGWRGTVRVYLVLSSVSLLLSDTPKDFFDFSTYFGGILIGVIFLVYAAKGKNLVKR